MLTQICQYLRNWFEREKYVGDFIVKNHVITTAGGEALPLLYGQYYRIIGSVFNDGVHRCGEDTLADEPMFSGAVWSMAVPPIITELADEISQWCEKSAEALNSPYQSESFGGYSYTLKTSNGGGSDNTGLTWQSQFAAKLAPWRKI